ncbi:hypothetical protein [Paenochrobactrum pullorum]|uniref:hypothetical protein n=1 Tax=Paenochrobactrum pullorum TaxID=1324351 RepID=UPI0035BBBE2E
MEIENQRIIDAELSALELSEPGKNHFFGYYNKQIWDLTGSRVLALQCDFPNKDLQPSDVVAVGYFDLANGNKFQKLSETTSWNWQMGAQLQWLEATQCREIIFNIRRPLNDADLYPGFGSRVVNVETGETREYNVPVYVVAPSSEWAVCVDYRRYNATHPTIGYVDELAPVELPLAPSDDGMHILDMVSGETKLILSLADLKANQPVASMDGAIHWISHPEIAQDSRRILFLHRWTKRIEDEFCWLHRLYSINPDGTDLYLLECSDHPIPQLDDAYDADANSVFDYEKSEYQISHPTWVNPKEIMVWGPHKGEIHYNLYTDRSDKVEFIGTQVLTENGHMTYSPNGRFILSDTYPDDTTSIRTLFIYDTHTGARYDIGRFWTDTNLGKVNRCDLHPRWRRDGRAVCIDSIHTEARNLYLIEVGDMLDQIQAEGDKA